MQDSTWRPLGKSLTDMAFTASWTTLCFFMVTIPLAIAPRGTISQWIIRRIWAPGLLRFLGARVEATGLESLEPGRTYIFMSNHMSHLDVPSIFRSVDLNMRFVAKRELLYIPFFGPYLYLSGYPLVDRSNRDRAIRSLEAAAARIRSGIPIVAFPEGTRSPDGQVQPFKKGPFMLALQAKVPLVPVSLTGSNVVLPKNHFHTHPGTIRVHFGQPMDLAGYTLDDRDRLMEEVRQTIIRNKAWLDSQH